MSKEIDLEAIKSRIAKLRKHAESAEKLGSKEEAITFTAKANELLLEYNLLESDINMDDDSDRFKKWAYSERVSFKCNQSGQLAKLRLVDVLCSHNLCGCTYRTSDKTFTVYGNMENVDQVIWLYNFLSIGLLRLAQESYVALPSSQKVTYNRYAYLKDFLIGAAVGIDNKLTAQKKQSEQSSNINSMIIYNDKALDLFLKKTNPNCKVGKSKTIYVGSGYSEGVKAGEGFSVNKPLQTNSQTIKQLK